MNMKKQTTRTNPDIPIIYEDNHLLVIDKPAGVLSQEDHTGDPDVLTLCKKYIKKKYNKPGDVWMGLVHRLDRPVSGVMVLARTSKAASRLSEQIRNNKMDKTYWAMVEGLAPPSATLIHYLEKDNRSNNVSAYKKPRGKAKESKLSFETIKQNANYSLVEIDLFTGRPHQIRVQMAKEGHPLWGDYRYGEEGNKDGKEMGLRAVRLTIEHPTKKEKMTFNADVPNLQPWNFFEY
ncbi:MAG: RluA family pseudouridine synthase [Balneola sp.]|nr:RluA family pseudouridine synthase [Balneola sp.]MBO6650787.1 RluA family pseudouridine synthase [Balneola sp.]MBO6710104.1 RluA family pseudouridine synthase [Balneola sp.]MBO6798788.1 RluA family pseudouridine synthase [Balneola sp.]MBO6869902.1 RluA family pseudouridine synthase [Balneola sp.]